MGMSATNQQIVDLAKRGFESGQIASALGMTEEGVQAVLVHDTAASKEIAKSGIDGKFEKLEDVALETIHTLMLCSEVDSVRAKMATYITDQRLGLKKPKEVTVNNFNVHMFMDRVKAARELRDKIVDVSSEVQLA